MPNCPAFYWELSPDEIDDGFGETTASALEIVNDGYQPCDGCARIHYSEETACTQPDGTYPDEPPPWTHCQCWYDCEPCHKCGADEVVIYGPPLPSLRGSDYVGGIQVYTQSAEQR